MAGLLFLFLLVSFPFIGRYGGREVGKYMDVLGEKGKREVIEKYVHIITTNLTKSDNRWLFPEFGTIFGLGMSMGMLTSAILK